MLNEERHVSFTRRKGVFARWLINTDGSTAIEYALIGGLISIAVLAGGQAIGSSVSGVFEAIAAKFKDS